MTRPPYAYKRSAAYPASKAASRTHDDPEHRFQVSVVTYLTWALPDEYRFTASAAGVRVGMATAVKMKAAGVRRGWLDIEIKRKATGAVRWLELKATAGQLTPEQKEFIAECPKVCAVARTLEDVEAALIGWGITPKMPVAKANRYA